MNGSTTRRGALGVLAGGLLSATGARAEDAKAVFVAGFANAGPLAGYVTGEGLTALLFEVLLEDGRWIVLDANEEGNGEGALTLVRGVVTKFDPAAGGGGIDVGGMGVGSVAGRAGARRRTALVEVNLRFVDRRSSRVILTASAEGRAAESGGDAGVIDYDSGVRAGAGAFKSTPVGDAAHRAIREAVGKASAHIPRLP